MIEIIPADYVEKLEENKFEFDGLVLTQEKKYSAYECEIRAISDDYMYEKFNDSLAQLVPVKAGIFGADMQVELINDGPVTIILDTKEARKNG